MSFASRSSDMPVRDAVLRAAVLRLCAIALALAVVLAGVNAAAAAAAATVEAGVEDGFGRVVLTFTGRDDLPEYQTRVTNGVLVVAFDEPVSASVDRLVIKLPDYVTVARTDPDGMAVRMALARAVKVNTMQAGEKLFIDLMPHDWVGRPPGLPQQVVAELAKRARRAAERARLEERRRLRNGEIPTVAFSLGRHPTFSRFAFRWSGPYLASFSRKDDTVVIEFDHPAVIDVGPVKADLPPQVLDLETAMSDDGGMQFRVKVTAEAEVRAFRDGDAYLVDVMTGDETAAAAEPGPVEAEVAAAVQAPGLEAAAPGSVTISGPSARREPSSGNAEDAPPAAAAAAAAQSDQAAPPETADPAEEQAIAATASPPSASTPAADAEDAAATAVPAEVEIPDNVPSIKVQARKIGDTVRLVFPFEDKTPAAVFRRGKTLWLVFDSGMPLDISAIETNLKELADDIALTVHSDWQTVRIDLAEPRLVTLGAEATNWIITVGDLVLSPSRPLSVERVKTDDNGAILHVPFDGGRSIRWIDDKTVGDRIVAMTGLGPPRGFQRSLEFVDLKILPSAHGIAMVPAVDNLRAAIDADKMVVSRASGLTLSNTTFRAVNPFADAVPHGDQKGVIDFAGWRVGDVLEFRGRLNGLHEALASLPLQERESARLDLIGFLLANGYAHESLGQIRIARERNPHLEKDPVLLVHEAAANVIIGRMADALEVLDKSVLKDNADAMLWRLLASAGAQQWSDVLTILPKIEPFLSVFPPDISADVRLAGIEAAVEANDFATAFAALSEIDPANIGGKRALRFAVLEARIADASGRSDEALGRYDQVIASGERENAAEALYRKTTQQFRDGKLNVDEGIDALEGLTTVWRGDDVEFQALSLLAKLYIRAERFADGFRTMRAAVHIAPEADTTRLLQDEMVGVFGELFLDGRADEMQPIEALSLYYDYRELTPIGRRGDEMVRRLAERLVGVDLLEQAEQLLAHQVENRLKGAARAEVAADLALIYLMDNKPAEALRALQQSRLSGLPEIVERRRRLIEARALARTGRIEIAIELLKSLKGADIDRTRADILWYGERWQQAAEQIERMYGAAWSEADTLKEDEQVDLIRAAIAFALAGDPIGLGRLRTRYVGKMAESAYAHAFDVVTGPIESNGVEFQSVVRAIASVDSLQAFLDEYRTRFGADGAKATSG